MEMKVIPMMTFFKKIIYSEQYFLEKNPMHSPKERPGIDHRALSPELPVSYSAFKTNRKDSDFYMVSPFKESLR